MLSSPGWDHRAGLKPRRDPTYSELLKQTGTSLWADRWRLPAGVIGAGTSEQGVKPSCTKLSYTPLAAVGATAGPIAGCWPGLGALARFQGYADVGMDASAELLRYSLLGRAATLASGAPAGPGVAEMRAFAGSAMRSDFVAVTGADASLMGPSSIAGPADVNPVSSN